LFHPDTHREDGDPDPAAMAGEKPRRRRHRQSTSAQWTGAARLLGRSVWP
jgi:hypothetical protein